MDPITVLKKLCLSPLNPRKVLTLHMCQDDGCTMNYISKELKLSTAAITGIADSLEEHRMIERVITRHDRRSFTIKTTKKGSDFLASFMAGDAA